MVKWLLPLGVMALCALAEFWHERRRLRLGQLAFGPAGKPRPWVAAAGPLRVLAMGALAWGLVVLFLSDRSSWKIGSTPTIHHVVIAIDVFPSMDLTDSGPLGKQRRGARAREVLSAILERLDTRRTAVSIVAFYTTARPVVVDTFDPDVVANILNDLPLEHAFTPGKTNIYEGVKAAGEIGKGWAPGTASLVMVSDGDTLPAKTPPALPNAFGGTLVIGVGDAHHGLFIDGHTSRQDADSLMRLALRLGGGYHDANSRHVTNADLERLTAALPMPTAAGPDWTFFALCAVAGGAAVLVLLPVALALAGSGWEPLRARPVDVVA